MGKLPPEYLKKLLSYIKKDSRVVVPPFPGFDSGVHRLHGTNNYLVIATDPCIGVPSQWFGWLLIHYVASDVALFGAQAEFCTINLLGAPSTSPKVFARIMEQACSAADDLGIAVVTGHTGTYTGLSTLLGVCTAYGVVNPTQLITPSGAEAGDLVFCVKPIGLEVAINLALTQRPLAESLFGVSKTRSLANHINLQSCVTEALLLADVDGVHAMHDATEGGLTAALNEMADAAGVGFRIQRANIPIPDEVLRLQAHFHLSEEQVLSLSSTGTIVAAVSPEAQDAVQDTLRQHQVAAQVLGVFTQNHRRILVKPHKETAFPQTADDPYGQLLSGEA